MTNKDLNGLVRINSKDVVQKIGNDIYYGTGSDGNVVVSSNTSITRDMYYQNLTINNGSHLNTNGYRVFVSNTITINGTIGVGASDGAISNGTVAGTTPIQTNISWGIGGNAFGNTYTVNSSNSSISQARLKDIENLVMAGFVTTTGTIQMVQGGAGGASGAAGTVTPATAGNPGSAGSNGNAGGSGGAGNPGGAGGAGTLDRNTLAPGGPGSAGNPGTSGTSGNPGAQGATGNAGNPGTTPPAAAAGVAGRGGPIVAIIAKTITGTGSVLAQGQHSTAGGLSATGSAGNPGTTGATGANGNPGSAGANGNPGTAAPGQAVQFWSDNHIHYRTGDGTHGPHASQGNPGNPLPHGSHVPYIDQHYHGYIYRYVHMGAAAHNAYAPNSGHHHQPHGPFGHHYNDYHNPPAGNENYFAMNGIGHHDSDVHHHRNQPGVARAHFGTHYSGSYNHNHDSPVGHYHGHIGKGDTHLSSNYPRNHHDNNHGQWRLRNAGTVSHSGHLHKAGGSAGARGNAGNAGAAGTGGAGGAGGTGGAAGSTTAGTAGQSGGGGAILIVSETQVPGTITLSAIGGALGANQASSGTIIQLVNA